MLYFTWTNWCHIFHLQSEKSVRNWQKLRFAYISSLETTSVKQFKNSMNTRKEILSILNWYLVTDNSEVINAKVIDVDLDFADSLSSVSV